MKTIQYWGAGNIHEGQITGKSRLWYTGMSCSVEDTEATALLAYSSDFRLDQAEDIKKDSVVTATTNPLTGGVDIIWSDGKPIQIIPSAQSGSGSAPVPLRREKLHVASSTPLDFSALRKTAAPAGSRGRVQICGTDTTKLAEASAPNAAITLTVAQWAPDATSVPLPLDKAQITAAVEHLARCGYNALRLHGIEYWLMDGTSAAFEFPSDRLDAFDWLWSEAKRVGLYLIINPRQPELYQAGSNRFSMPGSSPELKSRLFVQQNARDHYVQGFNALYNRVNRYTGINMVQDPALWLIEWMNESSAQQTAQTAWPAVWSALDSGATRGSAALTWKEWLADPGQSHGYADLAALNTAWGTAHASFAAIPSPSSNLPNLTMPQNRISVDVVKYIRYLDDSLADFFQSCATTLGYAGLQSSLISFPNMVMMGNSARKTNNHVVNLHDYPFLSVQPANGAALSNGAQNTPVWEWGSWVYQSGIWTSGKPAYLGEYGWPYWGQYRNQYPLLAGYAAHHGASAVTIFHEGDFFAQSYSGSEKDRTKKLFPYSGHADPVVRFSRIVNFLSLHGGAVAESAYTQNITLNDRYYGMNPVNTGRVNRSFFKLYLPTATIPGVVKTKLNWTSDTTDDSLAATLNITDWKTHLNNLLGAGAISADNASLVSANANAGNITAVTTSGTVGAVTASATQPVLNIGSNTLVDGDFIAITNLAGSGGTWPGTNGRGTRFTIKQTGVANQVQITSGLNLTGLSGFTSGTWCELDNVVQSANKELFLSRRQKICWMNTARLKYFADGGASGIYPYSGMTNLVIDSISSGAAVFAGSLDGNPLVTSNSVLLGLVGNVRNAGETMTDATSTTLATVGDYPIIQDRATCNLKLKRNTFGYFELRGLESSGEVISRQLVTVSGTDFIIALDVGAAGINFWHLVKID